MKASLKDIWEFLREFFSYLLGVSIDGGKGVGGWKGYLFLWPFVLALIVIIFLIIKVFID